MNQLEAIPARLSTPQAGRWLSLPGRLAIPVLASLGVGLVLLFLATVLARAFTAISDEAGLAALAHLFGRADYYLILLNTFYFAAITTATAMAFGVPLAWLTERTELPGRELIRVFMIAGIVVPGFFTAMGWLFLAHPRIGMINALLQEGFGLTLNVATLTGMGLVQGLALASLAFVVAAPALAAVDPALEESAEVHGLGPWARLTSVTLPLVTPALVASALLTFMVSLAVFDIPAVLGLSNKIVLYSTYVYGLINPVGGVPLYEQAAASGIPMLLLACGLSLLYFRMLRRSHRFQVVSGKAYRSKRAKLTRRGRLVSWCFVALYLTLAVILPLLTIAWVSLLPFFRPVSVEALPFLSFRNYIGLLTGTFWQAASNSLAFAILAPSLTVVFSLGISWMCVRHRGAAGRWFELIAFVPLSVPSVIFAVGAISLALMIGPTVPIYGTIWLIILVEIVVRISIATRITNSAMLQIHKELDEAGAVFGLSAATRFLRILVPLLVPAIIYCWFFLALMALRELTVPALLVSRDNLMVSVYAWGLLGSGSFGLAAAMTMVIVVFLLGLGVVGVLANGLIGRVRRGRLANGASR